MKGITRKTKLAKYLIFRVDMAEEPKVRSVFLTEKGTWTPRKSLARKDSLSAMKALVGQLKANYPDLILEQCRD